MRLSFADVHDRRHLITLVRFSSSSLVDFHGGFFGASWSVSDIHSEVLASVMLRAELSAGLISDLTWDVNFTFS